MTTNMHTRSFFPVQPPPLGSCLDLKGSPALSLPGVSPHVLLLPSDLTAFAKAVPLQLAAGSSNCCGGALGPAVGSGLPGMAASAAAGDRVVAVNPGRVMRGNTGGSFAVISVQPGEGSTASRCRVEVCRM
jgi:hypothetical protein